MHFTVPRTAKFVAAASACLASLALAGPAMASAAATAGNHHAAHPAASSLSVRVILNGAKLHHKFVPAGKTKPTTEALADPDDITNIGRNLFTAFQNGVGSQGEASSDGNTFSTVVEFTPSGKVVRQWDIKGKCDGVTADRDILIATVNEDGNSSIYTIAPFAHHAAAIQHYRYPHSPLAHGGGTDAISIYHGFVLVSASAPGTVGKPAPQPTDPAVYVVTFNRKTHVAGLTALFGDEATATVANVGSSFGKKVKLALTDPDSNQVVPFGRFGGDFMLTSQGDKEDIFVAPSRKLKLAVLRLSQSTDDTTWVTSRHGTIYGSDTSGDTIDTVSGALRPGTVYVAVTPCDANGAPATCPTKGFPANYLGQLNLQTGHVSTVKVTGATFNPQGLRFIVTGPRGR